jgi:UDP-glucose 4-epimerase
MNSNEDSGESWLITGGLGYIGAHVAREFIANQYKVYIVDNLSTGLIERLPIEAEFINSDVQNSKVIYEICKKNNITGIVHLAAFKHARDSIINPLRYFENNVGGVIGLLKGIEGTAVRKVLFSSSCSIYGNAIGADEKTIPNPQSPYALSKLISEEILSKSLHSMGVAYTALRFFNVIGCDDFPGSQDQSLECLVPVIIKKIKESEPIEIFGTRLQTEDGTCIRDYLDVRDIVSAHSIVAKCLQGKDFPTAINVSSGRPTSVKEVLVEFENILQRSLVTLSSEKNPADPDAIWSLESNLLKSLGWKPKYSMKDSISSHISKSIESKPNL